jgi:NADP-dependent 3-hydroxy acid dehydrogenase YdfG
VTVVAVTDASAGVGRATARAFARDGADVGLIARGRERLETANQEIEAAGRRAVVAEADVANANQVEAAAQRSSSASTSTGSRCSSASPRWWAPSPRR